MFTREALPLNGHKGAQQNSAPRGACARRARAQGARMGAARLLRDITGPKPINACHVKMEEKATLLSQAGKQAESLGQTYRQTNRQTDTTQIDRQTDTLSKKQTD